LNDKDKDKGVKSFIYKGNGEAHEKIETEVHETQNILSKPVCL